MESGSDLTYAEAVEIVSAIAGGVCHGYSRACVCTRCQDRQARYDLLLSRGHRNAALAAKKQSADYFERPWMYRRPTDGGPPEPLRSTASEVLVV